LQRSLTRPPDSPKIKTCAPSILRNCNPEPAIDSRRMRGAGDGALKHGAYARYMQNTP
jgi:hypothetical protein